MYPLGPAGAALSFFYLVTFLGAALVLAILAVFGEELTGLAGFFGTGFFVTTFLAGLTGLEGDLVAFLDTALVACFPIKRYNTK